jgi:hypothetical protein
MGPVPLVLIGAVLLAWSACLPAQTAGQRRPTFARAETATGEPLAGAVVTFAGRVPHLGVDVVGKDIVRVGTDARGRAQAKLLPGLCYTAWVESAAGADGRIAVSAPNAWFSAGALVALRAGEPEPPQRLQLRGLSAWAAQGPLQFHALFWSPGPELPLVIENGELVVPPGPVATIEVRTASGEPLWHAKVADGALVLPPPRRVRVHVVDDNGAPMAGALLRHRVGRLLLWRLDNFGGVIEDRWRELGRTGADGRAEVEVPYAGDPLEEQQHGDLLLFASFAGRPAVAGGVFQRGLYRNDHLVAAGAGTLDELQFVCRPVPPLSGNIGAVPAGSSVHLAAVCKLFVETTSYNHDARSFTAPVAADGSFAFTDLPAELHSGRLSLVPGGAAFDEPMSLPMFQTLPGRELPALVASAAGPGLIGEAVADLRLVVTDAGGGPARGTIAFVAPAEPRGVLLRDSVVRVPLDPGGATNLRLSPGAWVVMAASDTGYVAKELPLTAGAHSHELRMQALQQLRIELRDDQGRPIAGARLQSRGTTTRGSDDPLHAMLQGLRNQQRGLWATLRTDAEGRMVIPFVPIEGVVQKMELQWAGRRSEEFVLSSTGDSLLVRPL